MFEAKDNPNKKNSWRFSFVVIWKLFISDIGNCSIGLSQLRYDHAVVLLFHSYHDETARRRKCNVWIEMVQFASQITKILHLERSCCATTTIFHRIRLGYLLIGNAAKGNWWMHSTHNQLVVILRKYFFNCRFWMRRFHTYWCLRTYQIRWKYDCFERLC